VDGTIIIDGSLKTLSGTDLINEPVTLNVKDNNIISIKGGSLADKLEKTLRWGEHRSKNPRNIRKIGEVGIGTNQNASIVGSTILNEKTYGSAHVAIGNNYWFGGHIYCVLHLDQVFKDPIVMIDGKKLDY